MANSILSALIVNPDAATSKVKLMLDSDINKGKVLIVVEGMDDKSLYQRMYEATRVEIVPVYNCDKVAVVIQQLNRLQYNKRLIGIKDADFDILNHKQYHLDNLFLTDYHDAEMQELSSNNVLVHIWEKYAPSCPMPNNMFKIICHELLPLSMLKWYNMYHGLRIVFDCVKTGSSFDKGIFDYGTYENRLFSQPDNHKKKPSAEDLKKWFNSNCPDIMQVTNGHDAVDALYEKIRSVNKQNLPKKEFSRDIRDYYSTDEFHETNLAKSISNWAGNHHVIM